MKKTGLFLLVMLMMTAPAESFAKKIVYLKSQSGAEAYYKGDVNELDQPEGEGTVIVERGSNVLIGKSDEMLRLTGKFTKDGVTDAVLTINGEPQIVFQGTLTYSVSAGVCVVKQYENRRLSYEQKAQDYQARLGKFQRAAGFLSPEEQAMTRRELDAEKVALDKEFLDLWVMSSAVSEEDNDTYAVFQFTLRQGSLEMAKWSLSDGSDICRDTFPVLADSPTEFLFVCNNGNLRFLTDIVARSTEDEQKLQGDVVGGFYVEDVHLFNVAPKETLLPKPATAADLANVGTILTNDPWYRQRFSRVLRSNYLKGRRKVDGMDQHVTIDANGVRIATPITQENCFYRMQNVGIKHPFLELGTDGIYMAENRQSQNKQRHLLGSDVNEFVLDTFTQTLGDVTVSKASGSNTYSITHHFDFIDADSRRQWNGSTYEGTISDALKYQLVSALLMGKSAEGITMLTEYGDGVLTFADGTQQKIQDGKNIAQLNVPQNVMSASALQEQREHLSLNLMTDQSVHGPWREEGNKEERTWHFNTNGTLALGSTVPLNYSLGLINVKIDAKQMRTERKWSMDNHLIAFENIPLEINSFQLDYSNSGDYTDTQRRVIDDALPAFKQLMKETQQNEWKGVVGKTYSYRILSFVPERMVLEDNEGQRLTLVRDVSLMNEAERKAYRAATETFNSRLESMLSEQMKPVEQPVVQQPVAVVAEPQAATPTVPAQPTAAATTPTEATALTAATSVVPTASTPATPNPDVQKYIAKARKIRFSIPKIRPKNRL